MEKVSFSEYRMLRDNYVEQETKKLGQLLFESNELYLSLRILTTKGYGHKAAYKAGRRVDRRERAYNRAVYKAEKYFSTQYTFSLD